MVWIKLKFNTENRCYSKIFLVLWYFLDYHAPLDVYHQLDRLNENMRNEGLDRKFKVNLCVGKEWYRFPSSFFLPKGYSCKFRNFVSIVLLFCYVSWYTNVLENCFRTTKVIKEVKLFIIILAGNWSSFVRSFVGSYPNRIVFMQTRLKLFQRIWITWTKKKNHDM